jgi:hypothetical protein
MSSDCRTPSRNTLPSLPSSYGQATMATNLQVYNLMDFADNSDYTSAEFGFILPSDYDGGTVTAKFYWTANSTSTNSVFWGCKAVCFGDDVSLDGTYGTAQTVTDANKSTAYKMNISGETPAITIAGTPAAGKWVQFRVYRYAGDASDTLAATARLFAVRIKYTRA